MKTRTITDEQIRALRRAAAAAGNGLRILLCDLALEGNETARRLLEPRPLKVAVEDASRDAVRDALVLANGNVRRAAEQLAAPYSTLHRRIGELGLRTWLTEEYDLAARQPAR